MANPFIEQLYDEKKENQLSAREMLDFGEKIRKSVKEAEGEKGRKLTAEERREVSYEAVHGDKLTAFEVAKNGNKVAKARREQRATCRRPTKSGVRCSAWRENEYYRVPERPRFPAGGS